MGMDVWGKNPSGPEGKYFRANIWSWRPIHALIGELCADLIDEETMGRMSINVGAGPSDPEVCQQMAARFDQWLEHNATGKTLDLELRVTTEGRFVTPAERAANPELQTESPYQVQDEHLKEWVTFLRSCGGFEVW